MKLMKSVKILTKCTFLKGDPLNASLIFFVSESGETYHRCIAGRIMLSARKSRVIGSSDLELNFEGQGGNFALLVKLMG